MAKEQNKKVDTTQPKKDQNPGEDTFEKDNNTYVAATPKSKLTSDPSPDHKKAGA